jgi:hypothetical protein
VDSADYSQWVSAEHDGRTITNSWVSSFAHIQNERTADMSIDPEVIQQLKEKAQDNRAKRGERVGRDPRKAPVVYVPTGTTLLRFYFDSENKIMRTLIRHKIRKVSVPCLEGCPVCAYLSEMGLKYPYLPEAWKLRAIETTISYAWIFSCSEGSSYVKTEKPVLLMGNHRLGWALNDHIADIDEESFAKMVNPQVDHFLWELKCGQNNRDLSLAPSLKTGTMEALPDTLYPLSQCIHPEGEEPDTEQISRFMKVIDGAYRAYLGMAL